MKHSVILTGANGQLGQCLLKTLIEQKYEVVCIDILSQGKSNLSAAYHQFDITDEEAVSSFFEELNIDCDNYSLINNAGVGVFTPFKDRTLAELQYVMNVNLCGTILMSKYFMERFSHTKTQNSIVNLGSIYGEVAPDFTIYGDTPRMSSEIYGMTKAAIINFTKYLASYYRNSNCRFNSVSPGGIEHTQGSYFKEHYSRKVPMGRMANVQEIADVVQFLISSKASYVNGENIFVDGGFTKW